LACGSNVEIWSFRVFPFSTRSNQILWGVSRNTPSQILYELLVHLSTQKNGAGPRLIKFFSMNNKNYVAFQSKINNPTLQCNVSFMIKARFSIESNTQNLVGPCWKWEYSKTPYFYVTPTCQNLIVVICVSGVTIIRCPSSKDWKSKSFKSLWQQAKSLWQQAKSLWQQVSQSA
jgi:hypothetical protein